MLANSFAACFLLGKIHLVCEGEDAILFDASGAFAVGNLLKQADASLRRGYDHHYRSGGGVRLLAYPLSPFRAA